jgi:hypothetical protein
MLKRHSYHRSKRGAGRAERKDIPARYLEYENPRYGLVWSVGRFVNRLAEAWYRQAISMFYQMRGYLVVYDRHFLFDSACEIMSSGDGKIDRLDRVYFWILSHWYPKPDLAIFLDAPAGVLLKRKRDTTPAEVNRRRDAFREFAKTATRFVSVDANQSLEEVLADVNVHISSLPAARGLRRGGRSQESSDEGVTRGAENESRGAAAERR